MIRSACHTREAKNSQVQCDKSARPGSSIDRLKVARYGFLGSIPPTFERKLRRNKQRFGKIDTTDVLDKDENNNIFFIFL